MTSFPLYFDLLMRMSFTDVKYEEITFSVQFPSFIVQKLSLFTLSFTLSLSFYIVIFTFTSKLIHFPGSKNELEILQIAFASTLCPLYFGFRYIKILEGDLHNYSYHTTVILTFGQRSGDVLSSVSSDP